LRARAFKDLLEVQIDLVRAETTSRMAMRPLDALKETTVEQAVD
jgi:hypothetical protein